MNDFIEAMNEYCDDTPKYEFMEMIRYKGEDVLVCVLLNRENGDGYVDIFCNIPEFPDKEYRVICIDYDIWLNKSIYRFVVGHELAHIDTEHLIANKCEHRFHYRNVLMEIYCDIKSLESVNDINVLNNVLSEITEWASFCDHDHKNYDLFREFELRKWFIRKLKQGRKITSGFLYEYINRRIPEINIEITHNLKEAEKFLNNTKHIENSEAVNNIYINKQDKFYI